MVFLTPLASRLTSTNRPSWASSLTMASPGAMRSGRSPRMGTMVSGPVQTISKGSSAELGVGLVAGFVDGGFFAIANWRVGGCVVAARIAGAGFTCACGEGGETPPLREGRVVDDR